jgi:hypothetical protein
MSDTAAFFAKKKKKKAFKFNANVIDVTQVASSILMDVVFRLSLCINELCVFV